MTNTSALFQPTSVQQQEVEHFGSLAMPLTVNKRGERAFLMYDFSSPGGSGKTVTSQWMANIINAPHLFITPGALVEQSREELAKVIGADKVHVLATDHIPHNALKIGHAYILSSNSTSLGGSVGVLRRLITNYYGDHLVVTFDESQDTLNTPSRRQNLNQIAHLNRAKCLAVISMSATPSKDLPRGIVKRVERGSGEPVHYQPEVFRERTVLMQDVIASGLIKKGITINPGLDITVDSQYTNPDNLKMYEDASIHIALQRQQERQALIDEVVEEKYTTAMIISLPPNIRDEGVAQYYERIKRIAALYGITEENGGLACYAHGKKRHKGKNVRQVTDFKDHPDLKVVVAGNESLRTGVNMPSVDCVIDLDSSSTNQVKRVQLILRVMRNPGKTYYGHPLLDEPDVYTTDLSFTNDKFFQIADMSLQSGPWAAESYTTVDFAGNENLMDTITTVGGRASRGQRYPYTDEATRTALSKVLRRKYKGAGMEGLIEEMSISEDVLARAHKRYGMQKKALPEGTMSATQLSNGTGVSKKVTHEVWVQSRNGNNVIVTALTEAMIDCPMATDRRWKATECFLKEFRLKMEELIKICDDLDSDDVSDNMKTIHSLHQNYDFSTPYNLPDINTYIILMNTDVIKEVYTEVFELLSAIPPLPEVYDISALDIQFADIREAPYSPQTTEEWDMADEDAPRLFGLSCHKMITSNEATDVRLTPAFKAGERATLLAVIGELESHPGVEVTGIYYPDLNTCNDDKRFAVVVAKRGLNDARMVPDALLSVTKTFDDGHKVQLTLMLECKNDTFENKLDANVKKKIRYLDNLSKHTSGIPALMAGFKSSEDREIVVAQVSRSGADYTNISLSEGIRKQLEVFERPNAGTFRGITVENLAT